MGPGRCFRNRKVFLVRKSDLVGSLKQAVCCLLIRTVLRRDAFSGIAGTLIGNFISLPTLNLVVEKEKVVEQANC